MNTVILHPPHNAIYQHKQNDEEDLYVLNIKNLSLVENTVYIYHIRIPITFRKERRSKYIHADERSLDYLQEFQRGLVEWISYCVCLRNNYCRNTHDSSIFYGEIVAI